MHMRSPTADVAMRRKAKLGAIAWNIGNCLQTAFLHTSAPILFAETSFCCTVSRLFAACGKDLPSMFGNLGKRKAAARAAARAAKPQVTTFLSTPPSWDLVVGPIHGK